MRNRRRGECRGDQRELATVPGDILVAAATGKMPVVPVGGSRSVATASVAADTEVGPPVVTSSDVKHALRFRCEFTVPDAKVSQRLLDNITNSTGDGFLADVNGGGLRLILGKQAGLTHQNFWRAPAARSQPGILLRQPWWVSRAG